MPEEYAITGEIELADNAERAGIQVLAFDRDLPSREHRRGDTPLLLGESWTDEAGRFQIVYAVAQYDSGDADRWGGRPQRKSADLSFRAFGPDGHELNILRIRMADREYARDQIMFNVPATADLVITVDAPPVGEISEYERYQRLIAPVIEDVPLSQLGTDDVRFLIDELGFEAQREVQQHLDWLRVSALLADETMVPIEAFYGWARTGLPQLWAELHVDVDEAHRREVMTSILDHLVATEEQRLAEHLRQAVAEHIIPTAVGDQALGIAYAIRRRAWKEFAVRLRLEHDRTGTALDGYMVTAFDVEASNRDIGTDVTDTLGAFEIVYVAPTGDIERSVRFRVRGPALTEPVEVTIPVRPNAEALIVVAVPLPNVQPTLSQLRAEGHLDIPDAVVETLARAGGIHSLADIRRRGGLGRIEALQDLDSAISRRLDALADLDRLTSDSGEMATLLERGFERVSAIADTPRAEFVTLVSANNEALNERRAGDLHIAAEAQTNLLTQMFLGLAADHANGFALP